MVVDQARGTVDAARHNNCAATTVYMRTWCRESLR